MVSVIRMVKEMHAYRELLLALTYRDIRVKYKQAVMGIAWAFFLPVLAIVSGIIVQYVLARMRGGSPSMADIAAVMIKTMPWLLFAGIIGSASESLLGEIGLFTKIYFPREVIPISRLLSQIFDFTIGAAGVTACLLLLPHSPVAWTPALLWLPVLLALLLVLSAAMGLVLACASLFFRDVKYIVQVLLRFGIFFTPVYFSIISLPPRIRTAMLANPVSPILEAMTSVTLGTTQPSTLGIPDFLWPWLGYSAVMAVGGLWAACAIFDRAEYLFAEYA